jgi:hypothetical protein
MIENLGEYAKGLGSAVAFMVIMYGGLWIRKVFAQSKRNTLNEIDLSAKKISLENQSKPIDQLVSDSNKSHGADEMVKPSGSDDKKGS